MATTNLTVIDLEVTSDGRSSPGGLRITSFVDGSATPGAATANTIRGRHAIAGAAASLVITNSKVSAASQIIATLEGTDGTLTSIIRVTPGAGSFTVTGNAAATAAVTFSWVVIN